METMAPEGATLAVTLSFTPASSAVPDVDHPGLWRAGERTSGPYEHGGLDAHECTATDWCGASAVQPDLLELGFDTVDLSGLDAVQQACARVREAGFVTDDDAAAIRTSIEGAVLRCSSGRTVTALYTAPEGFIMRTSGPNGLSVVGRHSKGMNGHRAAASVHADQDVYGTPLTQVMDGRAPSLFRHDSPDGHNHDARLMLVNLWIPVQQITQPLVLGDGRSIDRRRHQLRYGLPTDTFLDRDEDMVVNDVWTFVHDPSQQWYLRSEMDHRTAYVFNTLSTPHTSCALPGEDVAERCYRALEDAETAVTSGDPAACRAALSEIDPGGSGLLAPPEDTPPALRDAIATMVAVADEARRDPDSVCGPRAEAWLAASKAAHRRVVRMSLEMRVVVSIDT